MKVWRGGGRCFRVSPDSSILESLNMNPQWHVPGKHHNVLFCPPPWHLSDHRPMFIFWYIPFIRCAAFSFAYSILDDSSHTHRHCHLTSIHVYTIYYYFQNIAYIGIISAALVSLYVSYSGFSSSREWILMVQKCCAVRKFLHFSSAQRSAYHLGFSHLEKKMWLVSDLLNLHWSK